MAVVEISKQAQKGKSPVVKMEVKKLVGGCKGWGGNSAKSQIASACGRRR